MGDAIERLKQFKRRIRIGKSWGWNTNRVSYIGCAASSNLGDLILTDAAIKLMRGMVLIPNTPLSVLANGRMAPFLDCFGQLLLRGPLTPKGLVFGAGTLLNDPFFHAILLRYYKPGLNFALLGTSVEWGRYTGDLLEELAPILRSAKNIGVRDTYSATKLMEIGVESEVIGDIALSLVESDKPRLLKQKLRVGFNLCGSRGQIVGDPDEIIQGIADFIRGIESMGHEVVLFAMHPHDHRDLAALNSRLGNSSSRLFWWNANDVAGVIDFVEKCDVVIGQRLHAAILATGMSIPTVSVAYRPKCENYMDSIGMGDFVIRPDRSIDLPDVLLEKWKKLVETYESTSLNIHRVVGEYRKRQADFAVRLNNMFFG